MTSAALCEKLTTVYDYLKERGGGAGLDSSVFRPLGILLSPEMPRTRSELERIVVQMQPVLGKVRGARIGINKLAKNRQHDVRGVEGFQILLEYDPGFGIPGSQGDPIQIDMPKEELPHASFYGEPGSPLTKANIGSGMLERIVSRILDDVVAE